MNTYDLQIYRGITYTLSLTLTDVNGNPIDLTNSQVSGWLKRSFSDSGVPVSLNPTINPPASGGMITLNIPSTGSTGIPVNIGVYDVDIYYTGLGTVVKALMGNAYIYPGVCIP